MLAAGPAVAEAVKVTGLPMRVPDVALTELLLVPTVFPSVQLVRAAMPDPFVMIVAGAAGTMVPPPVATAKTTDSPTTGLPWVSVTMTEGGAATLLLISAL